MSRKKGKPLKNKTKTKGSAKSTPRRTPSTHNLHLHARAPEAHTFPKFTMFEEARWMSNHRTSAFDTAKQLRYMPVQFVSAGLLEGTIKDPIAMEPLVSEPPPVAGPSVVAPPAQESTPFAEPSSPDNSHGIANLTIRSPSPNPSESSVDEVVFRGRTNTPLNQGTTTSLSAPQPTESSVSGRKSLLPDSTTILSSQTFKAPAIKESVKESVKKSTVLSIPPLTNASSDEQTSMLADVEAHTSIEVNVRVRAPNASAQTKSDVDSDDDSVIQDQFEKRRGGRPIWEGYTTPWVHRSKPGIGWLPVQDRPPSKDFLPKEKNPRDAAMEDYMQNMEDFGLTDDMMAASGFAHREMDLDAGSHNDWVPETSNTRKESVGEEENGWGSDLLPDFDGISTSSELSDTVIHILSKRTRPSGLQYLCVYEGSTADDARWVRAIKLISKDEKKLIQVYEAGALSREHRKDSSNSSDEETNDDDADDTEEENDEEEELDDETLARVLQKQEELGLGSDEVMLYAGDGIWGDDYVPLNASSTSFDRPNKKRRDKFRGGRSQPTFASASAMADAVDMDPYNGFDIMDTDRPSLRPRKNGRRGQMPPELEDSDLNEQMLRTWEADRTKKRLKKAEREELRQQGLLGRKDKTPDLKVKYQDGIDSDDILGEIRDFLMSDMQSVALPPMEKNRRALVHQFADAIGVSSKSRGSGLNRFIVLSRTARTKPYYSNDEFDRVVKHKGFKFRMRASTSAPIQRGQRSAPQFSYKDGDVVGASAPELGIENKGRAMLEKMGWTKGTALGALDNKGILLPIAHTVKITKAGLK